MSDRTPPADRQESRKEPEISDVEYVELKQLYDRLAFLDEQRLQTVQDIQRCRRKIQKRAGLLFDAP